MKRRSQSSGDIFGLSFMDCICCGFGAVILLFVMTTQFNSEIDVEVEQRIEQIVQSSEQELEKKKSELEAMLAQIEQLNREQSDTESAIQSTQNRIDSTLQKIAKNDQVEREKILEIAQLKIKLKQALAELEKTKQLQSKQGDKSNAVVESPGGEREHYLTGLKVNGERSVILVDTSLSMLANNLQSVIPYRAASATDKLKSRKWIRILDTFDWLMATIESNQFQAFTFNDQCKPLLPASRGKWLNAKDAQIVNQVSDSLWQTEPQSGSNLEAALQMATQLHPQPTHIYIITDGLPNQSSKNFSGNVSNQERIQHFKQAQRQIVNTGISVNTILFPFSGDPEAANYFWRLASHSKGSVFKPTPDWPN